MGPRSRAGNGRLSLAAVLTCTFVIMLDTGAVYVVAPSVRAELGADRTAAGWLIMGYSLAYALLLVPGDRLGGRFGHEPVLLASLAGVAASSALCATAQSADALVGWRVVQGAAAGVLNPQILGLLPVAPRGRGPVTPLGLHQATSGAALVLGPLLAGALIFWDTAGSGWRWVFLLNPALAVPLLAALALRPRGRAVATERPYAARDGSLPTALLRDRRSVLGVALGFWHFGAIAVVWYGVASSPRWYDGGHSALSTGLALLPLAAGTVLATVAAGRAPSGGGGRLLWTGLGLTAAGVAGVAATLPRDGVPGWALPPSLLLAGAGSGLLSAAVTDLVVAHRPWREVPDADRLLNVSQRSGIAGGVAVATCVPVGTEAYGALGFLVPLALLAALLPGVRRPVPRTGVAHAQTGARKT